MYILIPVKPILENCIIFSTFSIKIKNIVRYMQNNVYIIVILTCQYLNFSTYIKQNSDYII